MALLPIVILVAILVAGRAWWQRWGLVMLMFSFIAVYVVVAARANPWMCQ